MKPRLSYIIWFSQRNGSTVLCKGLESTGIAGNPGEWLNHNDVESIYEAYETRDAPALLQRIWDHGTTQNGVFGLKYGLNQPHHDRMTGLLRQCLGFSEDVEPWRVWHEAFPGCKHIFLTRRNKVRQAVSWWKAIQSGEWHRPTGETHSAAVPEDAYNFDAINHLVMEVVLREAGTQAFFASGPASPLTVVYEDMVLDFAQTVQRVVEFLGVKTKTSHPTYAPYYERLADEISERWVQRYREERQTDWDNKGW